MLQLHFNSYPNAYLVPIELILCIMEKIVLPPTWCDFNRDKMSIRDGVEVLLQQQSCTLNRVVAPSLNTRGHK